MAIRLFVTDPSKGVDLASLLKDERITISRTPFGASDPSERIVYAKRAVAWKGKKFRGITDRPEEEAVRVMGRFLPKGTAEALYKIAKDSKALKGKAGGVWLVDYDGKKKVMPGPAVLKLAKKIYIAEGPEALKRLSIMPVEPAKMVPGRLSADVFAKVSYDEVMRELPVIAPQPKRLQPVITV